MYANHISEVAKESQALGERLGEAHAEARAKNSARLGAEGSAKLAARSSGRPLGCVGSTSGWRGGSWAQMRRIRRQPSAVVSRHRLGGRGVHESLQAQDLVHSTPLLLAQRPGTGRAGLPAAPGDRLRSALGRRTRQRERPCTRATRPHPRPARHRAHHVFSPSKLNPQQPRNFSLDVDDQARLAEFVAQPGVLRSAFASARASRLLARGPRFRSPFCDRPASELIRAARREIAKCDEYSPSRLSNLPTAPGSPVHRTASSTIRNLYAAVNRRPIAFATTSGSAPAARPNLQPPGDRCLLVHRSSSRIPHSTLCLSPYSNLFRLRCREPVGR